MPDDKTLLVKMAHLFGDVMSEVEPIYCEERDFVLV